MIINRTFFLLILLPFACCGQSNYYYPTFFTAYFQNMSQITPAYLPQEDKAEFTCGYESMTGAFRKISSYYVTGSRTFVTKRENAHLLRLQFYNEKEGSYISSPRAYANYAYSIRLGEEVSLYSGIAIGAVGVYYSAPTTTQSSYTLPDGSIGLGIKSNWFDIGGSMMQAFNSTFSPVNSLTTFHRYYQTYASARKEWDSEWGIKGRALWRHLPSSSNDFLGTASLFYSYHLEFGSTLSSYHGLSFFTLIGIGNEEDRLNIMLNYNSTFLGSVPSWQSNLEVGLSYVIR